MLESSPLQIFWIVWVGGAVQVVLFPVRFLFYIIHKTCARRRVVQMSEPQAPPELTLIEKIEQDTFRKITIESALNDETYAKCNPQRNSPLFNKIPAEIRNEIFELALAPYDDPQNMYPSNKHYYRPDIPAKQRFNLDLLQTCRLIWLEANHIALPQAIFPFYYSGDRAPPGVWARSRSTSTRNGNPGRLCQNLTVLGQTRIRDVRAFAQLCSSPEAVRELVPIMESDGGPELVRFMIRHGDWWSWEQDARLDFHPFFPDSLLRAGPGKRLREVRVELETLEWKVNQLGPIVDRVRNSRIGGRGNGRVFELQPQGTVPDVTWSGPTNLEDREWRQYSGRNQLDYRVVTICWKVVDAGDAAEETLSVTPRRSARLEEKNSSGGEEARTLFKDAAMKSDSLLFLVE